RAPDSGGAALKIEEGVALSRFTTLGTGGPARAFARPENEGELERALAWAAERDLSVAVVGLGSNLLVADKGVDGLVLKLAGELGLAYRHSELRRGQVVARVELQLERRAAEEIKSRVAELQAQRKAAQPTNKRTFGSVFKNPEHELTAGRMLEACGLKGYRIGGAQISPKPANFIENASRARSEQAVALTVEARRRAHDKLGVVRRRESAFLVQ